MPQQPLKIQRAPRLLDRPHRHAVGVDHGRLQAGVAEFGLDGTDVLARLQQMGGKGVILMLVCPDALPPENGFVTRHIAASHWEHGYLLALVITAYSIHMTTITLDATTVNRVR